MGDAFAHGLDRTCDVVHSVMIVQITNAAASKMRTPRHNSRASSAPGIMVTACRVRTKSLNAWMSPCSGGVSSSFSSSFPSLSARIFPSSAAASSCWTSGVVSEGAAARFKKDGRYRDMHSVCCHVQRSICTPLSMSKSHNVS